jgi:hypothetical protein
LIEFLAQLGVIACDRIRITWFTALAAIGQIGEELC